MMETITLFRPIGQTEMDLIVQSDYLAFPPRLPFQPIFYPVLQEDYAVQIARDWNTNDAASGYVGYVTYFQVYKAFLDHYPIRTVGRSKHQEYWIPAEYLPKFNQNIVGTIKIIKVFKAIPK